MINLGAPVSIEREARNSFWGASVSIWRCLFQFGGTCFNLGARDSFGGAYFNLRAPVSIEGCMIQFWGRLFQ